MYSNLKNLLLWARTETIGYAGKLFDGNNGMME